jgi:membrane protein implicated in regulation of membrane protease activity
LEFALAFAVLAVVVALVVARPLRSPDEVETEDQRRAALEAAKEGKYREIRDAELDREMGKLSGEDWRAVDRDLRAQAIAILHELDELDDGAAEERG